MFKKSLFLGSVTLILLALIALAGCSNPASDGPSGAPGRESLSGVIDAVDLKELFAVNDTVQLLTGTAAPTTVAGEVPPGKTLEISGAVSLDGILEVYGVLDIKSGGELDQATPGTDKLYLDRGGRVLLNGFIYLEQELFQDQPILEERNNGEVSFDPRVALGATGGLLLPDPVEPVGVNNYFEKVYNLKWARETDPLTTATIPVLTNWVPGRTLILNGDTITTTTDIDVSDKGTLIIDGVPGTPANLELGAFTLTASGPTQNVIVGENGTVTFNNAGSTLAGNIKVKGRLSTSVVANTLLRTIPGTVDLTEATLSSTGDTFGFYFADAEYRIGAIDLTANSLTLRESRGLFIRSVTNTAAKTLTIPPSVTTIIEQVLTDGANALTIVSNTPDVGLQNAILKPGYVSGVGGLTLGANLYLDSMDSGKITVGTGSKITAAAITAFGSNAAIQSAVLGKIRGGTLALGAVTPTIAVPITINTILTTTGNLTIAADTTFNMTPALTGSIIINAGRNLIIASEVVIARGTALSLTEGVYQAVGADATILNTGVFTTLATSADLGLKIGASVADIDTNYISLTNTVAATATFTPTVGTGNVAVVFGKDGITLPGTGTDGALLTVTGGGNAGRIAVRGTGVDITLGAGTASGRLSLSNGAVLLAADSLTVDYNDAPLGLGDFAGQGTLSGIANGSAGIYIDAKTPADGAVITSATKSTN